VKIKSLRVDENGLLINKYSQILDTVGSQNKRITKPVLIIQNSHFPGEGNNPDFTNNNNNNNNNNKKNRMIDNVQKVNNCVDGNARLTQTLEAKEHYLMNIPYICITAHLFMQTELSYTITCLQVVDPPLSGYKFVFTISWPKGSVGATANNYKYQY
jgi:hypothetical protein